MPGLYLSNLGLSHFRSHVSARIVLDGRPVALFGPNGAGKTNVLEAISLLSPGRGLRRAAPEDLAKRPETIGWKVTAGLWREGGPQELATWAEGTGNRQVRIDGKAAPQAALGRVLRILWLVPAMDRLWLEAAEGRRRFLDRLTLAFLPGHGETVLAYEKAMRERNRLMRDGLGDAAWYAALEAQMAFHGAAIIAGRTATLDRLARAQVGAATAFPAALLALESPDARQDAKSEALSLAFAQWRRRDMAAGRALFGPHRDDLAAIYVAKEQPAAQCSTGEQKALLISLILAAARALAQDLGTPPLLLLDEVAAHLDAARRAALYEEVCAMGAQAFLTGTGPELFAGLGFRAQVLRVQETAGLSEVIEGELG